MKNISKEEFIKVMRNVEDTVTYHDKLNKFYHDNKVDGYLYQPDCVDTVLSLLQVIFNIPDYDDILGYFCWDLDFGKKWNSGMVTEDNIDIKLENADDLYNYLINYHNNKND